MFYFTTNFIDLALTYSLLSYLSVPGLISRDFVIDWFDHSSASFSYSRTWSRLCAKETRRLSEARDFLPTLYIVKRFVDAVEWLVERQSMTTGVTENIFLTKYVICVCVCVCVCVWVSVYECVIKCVWVCVRECVYLCIYLCEGQTLIS